MFRPAAPRPIPRCRARCLSRRQVAKSRSADRRALLGSAKSAAVNRDRRHRPAVRAPNLPITRPSAEGRPEHDDPTRIALLRATAPIATRLESGAEIGYVSDSQPKRTKQIRRRDSGRVRSLRRLSGGVLRRDRFSQSFIRTNVKCRVSHS